VFLGFEPLNRRIPWAEVLHKEGVGDFQSLDWDGVCFFKGVFAVGARSGLPGFKRPQPVSSIEHPVSFLSQFVLIDSHFLSLRIDLFRIPALMPAGQDEMAMRVTQRG
jgi:hypothetical protein